MISLVEVSQSSSQTQDLVQALQYTEMENCLLKEDWYQKALDYGFYMQTMFYIFLLTLNS